jgi:ABC-type sugar transport system ATPase subunit
LSITLDGVTKSFANGRVAVRALNLEIGDGELLVVVGPSGCGKSTVLRLIAGLEAPTAGRIVIDGRDMTGVPPHQRDLAMVFQSYALYPHKTVAENLAFGLRIRGMDDATIDAKVRGAAASLQIESVLDQKPAQLSGGQRQRVALGRAIVREPRAFLLDEPLSNLDPQLRFDTRAELGRLHRRLGATMVHVTHDQEEAMTLGDRVAVLRDGTLEQVAPPVEVYAKPANSFVATFVGSPRMNLLEATIARRANGAVVFDGRGFSIEVPPCNLKDGTRLLLGARPRDVELVRPCEGDLVVRIDLIEALGHEAVVRARTDDGRGAEVTIVVEADRAPGTQPALVGLRFRRDRLHLFDRDDGRRMAWSGCEERRPTPA